MIKIVLHIGRHKTGTSSLQRFLADNSFFLKSHRIEYPALFRREGIAHHLLAESFSGRELRSLTKSEVNDRITMHSAILNESLCNENVTYILSSEAFQNVNPQIVRRLFDPAIFDVKVVAYFREQIGYLASAYNQRVHATHYHGSIYSFYRDCFRADYNVFCNKWTKKFPNYKFRIYDRDSLYKRDLIQDFFKVVFDVELSEKEILLRDVNPSLNEGLMFFKRELNRQIECGELKLNIEPKVLYQRLGEMSVKMGGRSFVTPMILAIFVFVTYYYSNKLFLRNYMGGGRFSSGSLLKSIKTFPKINIDKKEFYLLFDEIFK